MARRQRLKEDVETVSFIYNLPESTIKDIKLDDETLHFRFDDGKGFKESFTLELSNYPDNCLLFDSRDNCEDVTGSLEEILLEVNAKYASKAAAAKPSKPAAKSEAKSEGEFKKPAKPQKEEEDSMDVEHSDELAASTGSLPDSGYMDLEGSGEFGLGASQEMANENRYRQNKALMTDLRNYEIIFGAPAKTEGLPALEVVEVTLALNALDVLEGTTCSAWGVRTDSPIFLKVPFSDLYYLEVSKPPKAELYQMEGGKRSKFGLKAQLEKLINDFITLYWPHSTGKKLDVTPLDDGDAAQFHLAKAVKPVAASGTSNFLGKLFPEPEKKEVKEEKEEKKGQEVPKDSIRSLMEMGFNEREAFNALTHTKLDVEAATDLLLSDPKKCRKPADGAWIPASSAPSLTHSSSTLAPSSARVNMSVLCPHADKPLKNLTDEQRTQVHTHYGFLVMLMTYMRRRITSVNDFCVICDKGHVFASGNMLKPAVCSRELCVWSFQQLGVGAEAAQDIATEAEVVDLLVSMAAAAVQSARKEVIFEPFPSVFDPANPKAMILDPKNKNFALVQHLLKVMPSVEQMSNAKDFSQLKAAMDKADKYCYALFQWIVSSNRSHIVQLPKGKGVEMMCTPHQYLLLSAPPEKEEKFRALKAKHGSTFAFHGSAIENWHSILRRGLINASGTKLQVNGAAYGNGIYLSPHAGTSFGYSRMGYGAPSTAAKGGNRFINSGSNIGCIALCEVINKDIRKSGDIWVQPDEDAVLTRFFFVYPDNNPKDAVNLHTQTNAAFQEEIKRAVDYYNH